jgi:hypothetical protein
MEICHGCGNKYDECICEELDAEMNEGKYPDDDPLDGDYKIPEDDPSGKWAMGPGH